MSWHKRLILEWMSAWQQQSHTALSATPNDGIHLLFYGHSWSSAAPIWPKCTISLSLLLSPCAIYLSSFFLFYPLLSSGSRIFIFRCSQFTLDSLSFPPPSSTSVFYTFPSFLCASLPWCSFYGQQPWAPHLSLSGLMCFRKGWVDVGVKAHEVPKEPNIRPICHPAAWWPRPFNLAGLWLCIFILRVTATWWQYVFFILHKCPISLSDDWHTMKPRSSIERVVDFCRWDNVKIHLKLINNMFSFSHTITFRLKSPLVISSHEQRKEIC